MRKLLRKKTPKVFALLLATMLLVPIVAVSASNAISSQTAAPSSASIPADHNAVRTSEEIYINGIKTDIRGYTAASNEYFMLRDVAKALDIRVSFSDGNISIDTTRAFSGTVPEAGSLPQTAATRNFAQSITINGKSMTFIAFTIDGEVYLTIGNLANFLDIQIGLVGTNINLDTTQGFYGSKEAGIPLPRAKLGEGQIRTNLTEELASGRIAIMRQTIPAGTNTLTASEFTKRVSDAIFGDNIVAFPERRVEDASAVKVGDIATITENDTATPVAVITVTEDRVTIGGVNQYGIVTWGRTFTHSEFGGIFSHAMTRYPN